MRILFFTHAGTNSRDIMLDMATGFERAGHDVLRWELEPMTRVYQAGGAARSPVIQSMTSMLADFIKNNGVDLSVGMWANALGSLAHGRKDGHLCSFFDMIENPHLMYWLDAPHWACGGELGELFNSPVIQGSFVRNVVNNEGIAREMTEVLGFSSAIGHRYGINEQVFRPYDQFEPEYDLVFGSGPGDGKPSPVMLKELQSDEPDVDAIRRDRAETTRPKLDEHAKSFGPDANAMTALFRALLERRLTQTGVPLLTDLAALSKAGHDHAAGVLQKNPKGFVRTGALLRSMDAWRRAFTITHLSQRMNCAIFGSASLDHWPCEAKMLGDLSYADMPKAYARGKIGLNAMRWQDDIGLNLKPYEITASGACLLCDRRVGFDDVFEHGVEAAGFTSPGQALSLANKLLQDDRSRTDMAQAGLARTMRDHTWQAIANNLVDYAIEPAARVHASAA